MLRRFTRLAPESSAWPSSPSATRHPRSRCTDQNGKKVKLTDFKGKQVVVYFYPKADTPGCTTQSCDAARRDPAD